MTSTWLLGPESLAGQVEDEGNAAMGRVDLRGAWRVLAPVGGLVGVAEKPCMSNHKYC